MSQRQDNYSKYAGIDNPDDWPLAVGEVTGVRIWRAKEGHLWPLHVSSPKPWTPGENMAICLNPIALHLTYVSRHPALHAVQRHRAPDDNCACGFYGYFADHAYAHSQIVEAITDVFHSIYGFVAGAIKGYGRTLVGTQGFRCEKAEITALFESHTAHTLCKEYDQIPRIEYRKPENLRR